MDWIKKAKEVFNVEKPEHFTNYLHCDECAEHDKTLTKFDIDTITLMELGNPGWDPICFCSNLGKRYYMPALIRLCVTSMGTNFYLEQFFFHLEGGTEEESFLLSCSEEQIKFIKDFLGYLIEKYPEEIQMSLCTDTILRIYETCFNSKPLAP